MKIATNVFPIKICLVIVLMEDKGNTVLPLTQSIFIFYFAISNNSAVILMQVILNTLNALTLPIL